MKKLLIGLGLGFLLVLMLGISGTQEVRRNIVTFRVVTTDTSTFQLPNYQAEAFTITNFTASDTLFIGNSSSMIKATSFPIFAGQSLTVDPTVNTNIIYGKFNSGSSGDVRGITFK